MSLSYIFATLYLHHYFENKSYKTYINSMLNIKLKSMLYHTGISSKNLMLTAFLNCINKSIE